MTQKLDGSLLLDLISSYVVREHYLALSISAHGRLMIIGKAAKVFAETLKLPSDSSFMKSLEKLDDKKVKKYEGFVAEMELVYATANLDSFLGELTHLLIASFPNLFLKQRSVSISDVLAGSVHDTINKTVHELALDIGHRGFLERLTILQSKLSVDFRLTADEKDELHRWAGVRNALMHDRSIFDIKFDPNLRISSVLKKQVSDVTEDRDNAVTTYRNVVAKIASALQTLCEPSEKIRVAIDESIEWLETPFLKPVTKPEQRT